MVVVPDVIQASLLVPVPESKPLTAEDKIASDDVAASAFSFDDSPVVCFSVYAAAFASVGEAVHQQE